ncbi:MAG: hypothetical protein FJ109_03335 [Deltaproteobacteria bacterium]|nr:hypothetical protein [Deltaproteobacteria bacterium]
MMGTRPSKTLWIVLVATVAAAIPLVAYLIVTGGPGSLHQEVPSDAPAAVFTPEQGLADLASRATLHRDRLDVMLGGEPLVRARDVLKEPGTHRATAAVLDLNASVFLEHGGNDLAEAIVRMTAALPPGTREVVSSSTRLVWNREPGPADARMPQDQPDARPVAASIGIEEDSVRIAAVWHLPDRKTEEGKPVECSMELTGTIRNNLLFARYDCPADSGAEVPLGGRTLTFSSVSVTGSQYVEVRDLALTAPGGTEPLLAIGRLEFKAAAALDRPVLLSLLAGDLLSGYSGWTLTLAGVRGDLAALELLPPLASLAPMPSVRFDCESLALSAGGEMLVERPRLSWPGRGTLKARSMAGRNDGRRSSFSFIKPEAEEATFGITFGAPELLAVRDEYRTWWITSSGYSVAPPTNPLKLAAMLNMGERLSSFIQGMHKENAELPPLLVPAGMPDLKLELTDGTAALPLGKGPAASGINLSAVIRGGMVESAQARVCLGPECQEADARFSLSTDSAGRVDRLALHAAGKGTARRLSSILPSPLTGVGNLEVELQAAAGQGQRITADFKVTIEELSFFHKRLALEPFSADLLRIEGSATLDLQRELLELSLSKAQLGKVFARLVGELEGFTSGLPRVKLSIDFPEQNCAHLLRSVPKGFAPELDQARLTGSLWFKADFELDMKDIRKSIRLDVDGDLERCEPLSLGPAFDIDALNGPDYVHRVVVNGEDLGVDVGPGTGDFAPLAQVPRVVRAAAYGTEDLAFFEHNGFRLGLIRRALILFLERGYFAYGGSTISQQLVKNLFLTRHKTISRKFQEAVIVWAMERKVSKERIFELYLNCIEYGPKIWGITRASRHYFGKHVSQLDTAEGAFLMGLKPDPGYGYLQFRRGKLNSQWKKQLQHVLKRLLDMGAITSEQYESYTRSELQFRPRSSPTPDASALPEPLPGADPLLPPDEDKPVPQGQEQGEL